MLTRAGPEIGVASTKAFTTQLFALGMLVIALARRNGGDAERRKGPGQSADRAAWIVEQTLELDPAIQSSLSVRGKAACDFFSRPWCAARGT